MTYAETLDYLYTKLPMFTRVGSSAFKKDLTNTIALCEALDNPQQKFTSIHVGGTNGKGSVAHTLAASFSTAGYKTGLYTSPHLYDFRERIKINGQMITEAFVIAFVKKIMPYIDQLQPSFFEITVAMAFDYFAEQKVDMAIIEVGLGGRLDSTNIIRPVLSVITNIGWDHMNMLGDTLEKIAFEKAGIIKEKIPVVIGESQQETENIFMSVAKEKAAPIYFADKELIVDSYTLTPEGLSITYKNSAGEKLFYETDLAGIYTIKNLRTVLVAVEKLNRTGWKISAQNLSQAIKQVKTLTGLMGRWQIVLHKPMVILEVAHNKEGIEQMLLHLSSLSFKQLHIVMGMVKDKDATSILQLLPAHAKYYFSAAHIPRALPAKELQQQAAIHHLHGTTFGDVTLAVQQAIKNARADDIVVVCGSIFLIAEVNLAVIG